MPRSNRLVMFCVYFTDVFNYSFIMKKKCTEDYHIFTFQIVSSAHYMLSDLYVPQDIDPDSPVLSDCSDEDSEWSSTVSSDNEDQSDDECNAEDHSVTLSNRSSSIKVSSLCFPHANKTQSQHYKYVLFSVMCISI